MRNIIFNPDTGYENEVIQMFNMILSAIVTVIIKDLHDNKKIYEQISKFYKKICGFIRQTMILYKVKKWLLGWYLAFKFFIFSD